MNILAKLLIIAMALLVVPCARAESGTGITKPHFSKHKYKQGSEKLLACKRLPPKNDRQ